jgi:hypothetical protein
MTANDLGDLAAAQDKQPTARSWEEWRQLEPQPGGSSEQNQEQVHPSLIPPYTYPAVPGKRSTSDTPRQERVTLPEVQGGHNPERPRDCMLKPGTHIPPTEKVCVVPEHHSPSRSHPVQQTPVPEIQHQIPIQFRPEGVNQPRQPKGTEVPHHPEEKTSAGKKKLPPAEEKTSRSRKRKTLKVFDGKGGRKHTEKQIEEILDWYLMTGVLPHYVSDRQRRSYKHHRTLPERRKLLEQQGIILVVPETGANQGHVIPMERGNAHGSRRASRRV